MEVRGGMTSSGAGLTCQQTFFSLDHLILSDAANVDLHVLFPLLPNHRDGRDHGSSPGFGLRLVQVSIHNRKATTVRILLKNQIYLHDSLLQKKNVYQLRVI